VSASIAAQLVRTIAAVDRLRATARKSDTYRAGVVAVTAELLEAQLRAAAVYYAGGTDAQVQEAWKAVRDRTRL
jgi:hypothetical protein